MPPTQSAPPADLGTREGVERAIATGALIVRLGILVQLVVGAIEGFSVAERSAPYVATAVVAGVVTLAFCVVLATRRRLDSSAWAWVDLAVAFLCVPVVAWALPDTHLIATWAYWPGALGINAVALASIWLPSWHAVGSVAVLMAATTLVATMPAAGVGLGTLAGNALTCLLYAGATRVVTGYLRGIADDNDQLRRAADRAGREAEMAFAKWTMHDPAGLLGLLGDEDTPREQIAPLRKAARLEANRLRAYLQCSPGSPVPSSGPQNLTVIVRRAIEHFGDQPIDVISSLASGVVIPAEDAAVLERALFTLLQNVRRHANAHHVIVHADEFGSTWELVVRDDGVGFDSTTTPLGFGLEVQVMAELRKRSMQVNLRSAPGEGTAVTITGQSRRLS